MQLFISTATAVAILTEPTELPIHQLPIEHERDSTLKMLQENCCYDDQQHKKQENCVHKLTSSLLSP